MTKKMKRVIKLFLPLVALVVTLSGCSLPGLGGTSDDTVRIAAQNTTEQQIMAAIIQGMIKHYSNLDTTVINNLGSATVSFQAQKNDEADLTAIRFNGTDYQTILKKSATKDPKVIAATVKRDFQKKYHMTYFPSYGFADTYQFMVTQKYAKEHNLNTVSDLKKTAPQMQVGIDQIWMNRKADGYGAFQKTYGFSFGHVYPMQIGLVYNALASNKMDAILGYSTDGRIGSYNLKLLKDDKQFFPPYQASVVANDKALKRNPQLRPILKRLDGKIPLKTMQRLNYQVDNNLQEPATVANKFLKDNNYFEGGQN
ncbi:osmoprotectant ABC transporter substrate-binding protein [Loigolactobacillus backii]|uniref:Glycine/betaine ABC transporter substrate-binding protein n=1 Tax=Loigolactobacillus backii TaxID=375175 RepID=A0A192H0I8_9LACO|nr:osmoprotectant ABC transporter substrate-binding protein [Loigolactobacillus backii]ANK60674.1 glycine/betaine ABC transporter substrate-binding protein [Loigolactobacillus backii]ANK61757.1 glycine/betaine ABC transporter substrate-binding protein [Loigolactobacillus backii]ANK65627.1 glycine/betaine ABC transporter substrate-binding protein [Loigolactobacillus backii]ANK68102.1 glycine/betaine ABC transporter substrate-binding protein [Loigolactobacillus backii]ANK69049.1 glycine/betaine 